MLRWQAAQAADVNNFILPPTGVKDAEPCGCVRIAFDRNVAKEYIVAYKMSDAVYTCLTDMPSIMYFLHVSIKKCLIFSECVRSWSGSETNPAFFINFPCYLLYNTYAETCNIPTTAK